jgi:hypothetical protein
MTRGLHPQADDREVFMDNSLDLPSGEILLNLLMITRERLHSGAKAAISIPILREILAVAISKLPYDEDFYLSTYEDIRDAYKSGQISNLRTHFMQEGYFEGRFGARPDVDEEFYKQTYPDVMAAISNGSVASGLDHYLRAGAAEGRFANSDDMQLKMHWLALGGKT